MIKGNEWMLHLQILAKINSSNSFVLLSSAMIICDTIKWNESKFADIVFEILAKKEFKFFCFILFAVLINCS